MAINKRNSIFNNCNMDKWIIKLRILNSILTAIMNWGVIAIIIIFQPELRRALEQLGTNKFTKFFGLD